MIDRTRTVLALGTAQTLARASSYYLPAVLATAMALELGISRPTVFAMFSAALLVSAMVGPLAGRFIDQQGGRRVLLASNAVFALGLAGLGLSQGPFSLALAWIVLGLAMGCGLYDAAFASLVRLYDRNSRSVITGITLLGRRRVVALGGDVFDLFGLPAGLVAATVRAGHVAGRCRMRRKTVPELLALPDQTCQHLLDHLRHRLDA